jgi:hypothetical protein
MKRFSTPIFAFLGLIVFCGIAVLFKVFSLEDLPASFIGAALGAIITGVVTAILLKAQSLADEIKERNAKVFEQKSAIFQDYINQIWKVWEDQKISTKEFQKLTANYYSKLMIYLKEPSVKKIRECLTKIGDCIDKEARDDYLLLRINVIGIINTLSEEINLGGKIDVKEVEELDSKMFPVIFQKTLIKEFKNKIMGNSKQFKKPQLKRAYSNSEWLFFQYKKYPDCKIVIGPFGEVGNLKIRLDVNRKLHQFDPYRNQNKGWRSWINMTRSDGKVIFLNEKLPQDADLGEIETADVEIEEFGFNDVKTLEKFRGNFRTIAALLAQRAAYYLTAITVNKEFSIEELPEKIIDRKSLAST